MGVLQLLASLWPFLKEILVGEKIKDNKTSKEGSTTVKRYSILAPHWFINKMQNSRRFLALIMVMLILSLFINYKTLGKLLAVTPPRSDEKIIEGQPTTKEPKEPSTIPEEGKEHEQMQDNLLRELDLLYGGRN